MTERDFQRSAEAHADHAVHLANSLQAMNRELIADVGETKRYLALARTAAQECELWLGKAIVAYASTGSRNGPIGQESQR